MALDIWLLLTIAIGTTVVILTGLGRYKRTADFVRRVDRTVWSDLIVMLIRWNALAGAIAMTAEHQLSLRNATITMKVTWIFAWLSIHSLCGFASVLLYCTWLSGVVIKTRVQARFLLFTYIFLPIAVIIILIRLQL